MIPGTVTTVRLRLESTDGDGPWGVRRVVRAFDGLVVGDLEFYGSPEEAEDGVVEVEVAVRLDDAAHGHGAGTEALRGILGATDDAAVRVRARVRPDNRAGLRMLAKCGFTGLRGGDEDGNLVMVRPLPAVTAS